MEYDVQDKLLSTGEVAELFRVHPKTVGRWAEQGKLPHVRTPGGHRRFFLSQIRKILEDNTKEVVDNG